MLYLGIDQHRKQLTVNVRNETGEAVLRRQVSTEWERVRAFFDELRRQAEREGGFVSIVELCGFNDWLLKMLNEYGCRETVLIRPEKRSKRKTDRRDAHQLSGLLWVNRHRLLVGVKVEGVQRIQPPSPRDAEDRQITEFRKRIGQLRTRTINRIKALLRKHNLEQEQPAKGLDTKRTRKWLAELPLGPIDRMEMDLLLTQWKVWDEQIESLEKEIGRRQAESETARVVATIPGCAAYGSLALAARIGPIERFPRPASLANYWGLTPSCRNSGEASDRLGSITKQGSPTARFILGQLVLHVLRRDAWMRAWYGRIKRRRGSKIARVAVMRRLATVIWHMLKNQEAYMAGGPPRRRLEAVDFRRDDKVSKGTREGPPAGSSRRRPAAPLAHLDPAIPCRVASPQSPTPLHRAEIL
ncbi:MAG: IS110 family transposase [Terracidiphilus sp.]